MMDEVWKREEVESPCVKLCIIHTESGLCMGCYRSGLEISKWSIMTATERQLIMQELHNRADRVRGKRRAINKD
ncbi:DUF1289 domain-containing protein [Amylibacter sp.]|nr:DUF1289 domain-containing protein [Amylibacter sp.]MDC3378221.1 DUF1289 domain-containing protein [Amylibacter sp.]